MTKEYISIQDASDLSNKSIQTIRRAIKARKFLFKKQRTPQGFNYVIEKDSLCRFYRINVEAKAVKTEVHAKAEETSEKIKEQLSATPVKEEKRKHVGIDAEDLKAFTHTLERLISQHGDERQSFLRLINNLQEKIFVLENQLNLLKAPEKKWFQFWS